MSHETIDAWALAAVLGVLYFVPSLIAGRRRHHQRWAIFTVNLLLGWTGIGWLWALIWSVSAVRRDSHA